MADREIGITTIDDMLRATIKAYRVINDYYSIQESMWADSSKSRKKSG